MWMLFICTQVKLNAEMDISCMCTCEPQASGIGWDTVLLIGYKQAWDTGLGTGKATCTLPPVLRWSFLVLSPAVWQTACRSLVSTLPPFLGTPKNLAMDSALLPHPNPCYQLLLQLATLSGNPVAIWVGSQVGNFHPLSLSSITISLVSPPVL